MFDIRLQIKSGEKMSDSDIQTARIIASEIERFADTARYMYMLNLDNFNKSAKPNFIRAEKNIRKIASLLELAYQAAENIHECYEAQFFDGEDYNEPAFDFSDQARIDHETGLSIMDAQYWLKSAKDRLKAAREGQVNGRLPELNFGMYGFLAN